MDDQDKTLHKVVSNTITTAIGFLPKLILDRISSEKFFKTGTNYEKLIISGRLCFPLTKTLSNTSSTHNYLLILHRL